MFPYTYSRLCLFSNTVNFENASVLCINISKPTIFDRVHAPVFGNEIPTGMPVHPLGGNFLFTLL